MKIIDGHCHLGNGRYKQLKPDCLLRQMDENGIDKSVVVPVDEYIAVRNEEGNAYIMDVIEKHPDRFIGFAVVNPHYGVKGRKWLVKCLEKGFRGVKFNPSLQGFVLNDDVIYPYIEIAGRYGVPVYFHTGTPVHSLPFHLSELAVKFPEVNFVMGHMGAWDFSYDSVSAAKTAGNIYLDTSLVLTSMVTDAINKLGPEKVIFGSDSPRSSQRYELEKVYDSYDEKGLSGVLYTNIAKLTGLEGTK